MQVTELIATELARLGINDVFGMAGDGEGLLEACFTSKKLKVHPANDQRLGMAMASGYSMAKRSISCYLVTQGPALANIAMPLLELKSQCLPLIIIGEGVSTEMKGSLAFQEFDSMSFMAPLTKWQYRIESVERMTWAINYAVQMALSGKPGPVYLEIPINLLNAEFNTPQSWPQTHNVNISEPIKFMPSDSDVKNLAEIINKFEKIVVIAGSGCLMSDAKAELERFIELTGAVALCTASGRGSISENNKNYLGLSGLYLSPFVKPLLEQADMFIFVGSQCEETAMMNISEFLQGKTVSAINVAYEDIGRNLDITCGIVGDAKLTLKALVPFITKKENEIWQSQITDIQNKCYSDTAEQLKRFNDYPVFHLCESLSEISKTSKFNLIFENGINEMWFYLYPFLISTNIEYFCPGEHTGLGIAYGNALGITVATQNPAIVVTGDGAFYFSISSLSIAAELGLGFTTIVLNNKALGWPKYHQNKHGMSCGTDFKHAPDLKKLSEAYGAHYFKPMNKSELSEAIAVGLENSRNGKTSLIDLDIEFKEQYPASVLDLYSEGA